MGGLAIRNSYLPGLVHSFCMQQISLQDIKITCNQIIEIFPQGIYHLTLYPILSKFNERVHYWDVAKFPT